MCSNPLIKVHVTHQCPAAVSPQGSWSGTQCSGAPCSRCRPPCWWQTPAAAARWRRRCSCRPGPRPCRPLCGRTHAATPAARWCRRPAAVTHSEDTEIRVSSRAAPDWMRWTCRNQKPNLPRSAGWRRWAPRGLSAASAELTSGCRSAPVWEISGDIQDQHYNWSITHIPTPGFAWILSFFFSCVWKRNVWTENDIGYI